MEKKESLHLSNASKANKESLWFRKCITITAKRREKRALAVGVMQRTMKIVNELPLKSLFCETSSVEYVRGEYLSEGELKKMLASGPLQFVSVSAGNSVRWHDHGECYNFWKAEVQPRLAEDLDNIDLSMYPNGYTYVASLWRNAKGESVVVLEAHH